MADVERAGVELHRLLPTSAARGEPIAAARSTEVGASAGAADSSQATSFSDDVRTREPAMEISVVLATAEVVKLEVDAHATANDILDLVIDKLHLYRVEARRMLGLWLVSRSLSLLLKPRHAPYQVACKWRDMLSKFTSCTPAEAQKEEPLLMLKRNVFASRDEDLNVKDVGVLELLAAEARVCVLSGDWPCVNKQLALQIAGSLARIQFGPYNESVHTVDQYKKHVSELLPAKVVHHAADKQQLYLEVMNIHENASKVVQQQQQSTERRAVGGGYMSSLPDDNEVAAVYHLLLAHCCNLPCYGSVFFNAYVERAHKSLLKGKHQQVLIGVNTSGVYILDAEKREPLFGGLLLDLTWELVDVCTCREGSDACPHSNSHLLQNKAMPCVLLQQREPHLADAAHPRSSAEDGRGDGATPASAIADGDATVRVLAVYTKSAKLIDALLDNVMELLTKAVPPTPAPSVTGSGDVALDVVDGPLSAGGDAAAQGASPFVWQERLRHSTYGCCKYDRVRTQRFSATGECLDTTAKK